MQEVWKNIEEYKGLYQVSNLGRIRNSKNKIMRQYKNHKGYLIIQLSKEGRSKTLIVHRIVAKAFIPNKNNKEQINHINCNKNDNNIKNLEWVTNKENKKHAQLHGLCKSSPIGGKNKRAKKVNQYDLKGNLIKKWDCMNDIARHFKLKSVSNISECCKNKKIKDKNGKKYQVKTAYGFIWKYNNDLLDKRID